MTSTGLAILATLRADGPALVCDLADRLDAPVGLLEAFLHALRAQGHVTCAFEGSPPVLTWRAAVSDAELHAHAQNTAASNPQHTEGATP